MTLLEGVPDSSEPSRRAFTNHPRNQHGYYWNDLLIAGRGTITLDQLANTLLREDPVRHRRCGTGKIIDVDLAAKGGLQAGPLAEKQGEVLPIPPRDHVRRRKGSFLLCR